MISTGRARGHSSLLLAIRTAGNFLKERPQPTHSPEGKLFLGSLLLLGLSHFPRSGFAYCETHLDWEPDHFRSFALLLRRPLRRLFRDKNKGAEKDGRDAKRRKTNEGCWNKCELEGE